MGHYIINNYKVFMTWSRDKFLRDLLLKEKPAIYKVASRISGSKESIETYNLMFEWLKNEFEQDPGAFYEKWIKIDLEGDEAKTNTWDILYDYCCNHKTYRLVDMRDYAQKILDDYDISNYVYPMSKSFILEQYSKTSTWWEELRGIKKGEHLSIQIETESVKKICGTFDRFVIYSNDFVMLCSDRITLYSPKTIITLNY